MNKKKKDRKRRIWIVLCLFPLLTFSQDKYRIISYNVENLYDYKNDPFTDDDPFTKEGSYNWTPEKYRIKLTNLAKAIIAVSEKDTAMLIGLCEVENTTVVNDLLQETDLKNFGYTFLHQDSPDLRGLDVALIYHPGKFTIISTKYITVNLQEKTTRDILFASGCVPNGDTLHVFVNHWPSRSEGVQKSEPNRIAAASVLRHVTDSLFKVNPESKILIMGDLNDYPSNASITGVLGAMQQWNTTTDGKLYNLSAQFEETGTYKYRGKWDVLDHFIVSGALLNQENSLYTSRELTNIYQAPFLLKKDKNGFAPKRSLLGRKFVTSGFSDHLPIYLDILTKTK